MTLKSLNGSIQKLRDRRICTFSFVIQGISALILIEQSTGYGGNPEDIERETRSPTNTGLFESLTIDVNPMFAPMIGGDAIIRSESCP
jgi:hypothetical protein